MKFCRLRRNKPSERVAKWVRATARILRPTFWGPRKRLRFWGEEQPPDKRWLAACSMPSHKGELRRRIAGRSAGLEQVRARKALPLGYWEKISDNRYATDFSRQAQRLEKPRLRNSCKTFSAARHSLFNLCVSFDFHSILSHFNRSSILVTLVTHSTEKSHRLLVLCFYINT